MKVLVTGGAGYLGSVLVEELLARGHTVRVLDAMLFGDRGLQAIRSLCSVIVADIRDASAMRKALAGMDAVIHLAALVGEPACAKDVQETIDINTTATRELAEMAGREGVGRFIFSSTCSNYGVSEPGVMATELTNLQPLSVYAETKISAEQAVSEAPIPGMVQTVFRLATLFGNSPRMRFDTLLNELVRDAECTKKLTIFGPAAWRPLIHVRDAVTAFVRCLELPAPAVAGCFNIVGGNHQKSELARLIGNRVPDANVSFCESDRDLRDYRVDASRWNALAGTQSFRSADEGVREVLHALRSGALGSPYDRVYRNA